MTKEEIYNGNKLIAEFLEWEDPWPDENLVSYMLPKWWMDDFKIVDDWDALEPNQMLFNSSLDWLHPAIKKIAEINYTELEPQYKIFGLPQREFGSIGLYSDIEVIYKAVVNFIIRYNKRT